MRPGLPAFDWWLHPPDLLRVKIFLFNITNAEKYLRGVDTKLSFQEVGPIVLKVIVNNSDVVFNDNSTLTYTLRQTVEYQPKLSAVSMNATLVYPNFGVLASASYFWNRNQIFKTLYNYVLRNTKSEPIVKKTVYQILYDNEDKFLRLAHATLPNLVPMDNVKLVPLIFKGEEHRFTVFIGTKHGNQKFFLLDKYNGTESIPSLVPKCKERAIGNGVAYTYSQMVPKSRVIKYLDPTMCRVSTFVYIDEVVTQGIKSYRFVQPQYLYNRTKPLEDDCYKSDPSLPDGLYDVSSCYFSYPVTGSNPYFMYGDSQLVKNIDGMKPDVDKYTSYGLLEPITGVIMKSVVHLQGNICMRPLQGFHKMLDKFSDMSIPLFYFSVTSEDLPIYVVVFLKFVLMLPYIGPVLSTVSFLGAIWCGWTCMKKIPDLRSRVTKARFIRKCETNPFIPRTN